MNPLLYYDSIYSLTRMKKQEDSYRQFIFEFISNEWNDLSDSTADAESIQKLSFLHNLRRVSNNGRSYSSEEVNDHVGTMLVAVSLHTRLFQTVSFLSLLSNQKLVSSDFLAPFTHFHKFFLSFQHLIRFQSLIILKQLKEGDTTSTALNFLFLMLAMHENVQHRLVEEINEVFGEYKDLIIDYEKLSELKYVEMVIKETLRLFSPATGKRSFTFFLNGF
jgi:Cytochrome P450